MANLYTWPFLYELLNRNPAHKVSLVKHLSE